MKTIYLLRHGKAKIGDDCMQDHDRPLAQRGKENAINIGHFIKQQGWNIDKIECSSSTRTRETYDHLNSVLKNNTAVTYDESLYLATCGDLIGHMQQLDPSANSVLFIGHNPGMHQACLTLSCKDACGKIDEAAMKFPTCALAQIELNCDDWQEVAPNIGTLKGFWDRHQIAKELN